MLEHLMRRSRDGRGVRMRARRHIPFVPLLLYYGAVLLVGFLLMRFVPGAEDAIAAPIAPSSTVDLFGSGAQAAPGRDAAAAAQATRAAEGPWGGPFGRLALSIFAVSGAVILALPVAGIYIHTRRLRYDPSLVQTMIILPIVVAGVVLVVKNSLALAFALAGIVAGVRFRQKLNEPEEAVYVLLALGLGLAAAVQALDIALAVSLAFNAVVLTLWRFDPRTLTAGTQRLMMGDTALLEVMPLLDRAMALAEESGMEMDGFLIVHAPEPSTARHALEVTLRGVADEWHMPEPVMTDAGLHRFDVPMKLSKNTDPVEVLAELEERWASQIAAAEYTPHRHRKDSDAYD
jgi:hypothetical protein